MANTSIPLYMDWTFWTAIASFIAIALSQLPPIHRWFKKAKIDIELYSKISLTHRMGNPNLQLHIIISNIGGRKIRIREITAELKRDGNLLTKLPSFNYLQNQNDQSAVLFTPFSLVPEQEWAHIVNLLNTYDRTREKQYQEIEANLRADFRKKRDILPDEPKQLIELDPGLVSDAHAFFEQNYIWESGEYTMNVQVLTNDENADASKTFRFTIFESHVAQLKDITDFYKYGGSIWWEPNNATSSVILEIKDA